MAGKIQVQTPSGLWCLESLVFSTASICCEQLSWGLVEERFAGDSLESTQVATDIQDVFGTLNCEVERQLNRPKELEINSESV